MRIYRRKKICKFEISVNLHHQIPVNSKVLNIVNIPSFITTQNPITKIKLLNLYGAFCFYCCWETWCQWFGFPLTECLWVFDNDDDCEDQWSWSCRHGWWLCAELIPGDKLLIGILSRIFSSWVKSILPHWFCYATSTRQVRPTYMSCLMTILTLQGVFPLLSLFNSISTLEILSIIFSFS